MIKETDKNKMSVWILDLIEKNGGMTFRQIQKALYERSTGKAFTQAYRGWWCDQLLPSVYNHGLLSIFCYKEGNLYKRNTSISHQGEPFKAVRVISDYRRGIRYGKNHPLYEKYHDHQNVVKYIVK